MLCIFKEKTYFFNELSSIFFTISLSQGRKELINAHLYTNIRWHFVVSWVPSVRKVCKNNANNKLNYKKFLEKGK